MRAALCYVLLLVLATHVAGAGGGTGDGSAWVAFTFQPSPVEATFTIDVAPATEAQIGYLVVREGREPAGFAHTFTLDAEGRPDRWDVSSGESPRLNSWSVVGDVTNGLHMEIAITEKWSSAPTQLLVWVVGDAPAHSWSFDGDVLSRRDGEGVFLSREDDFTSSRPHAWQLRTADALTGMFSVLPPSVCHPNIGCLADRFCVEPGLPCVVPPEERGEWEGPDGSRGTSTDPASYGGRGPNGWFSLAPAGEYTFNIRGDAFGDARVIVGGVDGGWRDPAR